LGEGSTGDGSREHGGAGSRRQVTHTILVLEPRRVAVKAAARRMAALLGEKGSAQGEHERNATQATAW
jgi:hypothetical protein